MEKSGGSKEEMETLISGPLWKKGGTAGRWNKRYFYLTNDKWMYFTSSSATQPKDEISTSQIYSVEKLDTSTEFSITMSHKKSTLRAESPALRDEWVHYIESVITKVTPEFENDLHERDIESSLPTDTELVDLAMQFTSNNKTQSFKGPILLAYLHHKCSFEKQAATAIGNQMISSGIIVSRQKKGSSSIESSKSTFRLSESITSSSTTSLMRMQIPNEFGDSGFDPKSYAHSYFKENNLKKAQSHTKELLVQREASEQELQRGLFENYPALIKASGAIHEMENDVSKLKRCILQCDVSISQLSTHFKENQEIVLPRRDTAIATVHDLIAEKDILYSLESFIYEKDYDEAINLVNSFQNDSITLKKADTVHKIKVLVDQMVESLINVAKTTCSNTKRRVIRHLIELGREGLASEMLFSFYDSRIKQMLKKLPFANPEQYTKTLVKSYFTVLLVCTKEYQSIFKESPPKYTASLVAWIAKQIQVFSNLISHHVFPYMPYCFEATALRDDLAPFRNKTKVITRQLRHVFSAAVTMERASGYYNVSQGLRVVISPCIISYIKTNADLIQEQLRVARRRDTNTLVCKNSDEEGTTWLKSSTFLFYQMLQNFIKDAGTRLGAYGNKVPELVATLVSKMLSDVIKANTVSPEDSYEDALSAFVSVSHVSVKGLDKIRGALQRVEHFPDTIEVDLIEETNEPAFVSVCTTHLIQNVITECDNKFSIVSEISEWYDQKSQPIGKVLVNVSVLQVVFENILRHIKEHDTTKKGVNSIFVNELLAELQLFVKWVFNVSSGAIDTSNMELLVSQIKENVDIVTLESEEWYNEYVDKNMPT